MSMGLGSAAKVILLVEKILQRCQASSVVFSDAFSLTPVTVHTTDDNVTVRHGGQTEHLLKTASEAPHTSDLDGSD